MSLEIHRAFLGIVCFVSALSAQSGSAIVSGEIKDTSGAIMPGVSLSIRNVDTNVALNGVSNSSGYYTFSNLLPGTYTLTAQFQGFRNLERSGILLQVGANVTLDLVMEVGAAGEQVTVTAEVQLLRTE